MSGGRKDREENEDERKGKGEKRGKGARKVEVIWRECAHHIIISSKHSCFKN